ncbi:MAG TPA: hypothetical protein VFK37_03880 [Bacillales bacterium]|nr:hypothetical protein [Bacillales bacterium]
MKGFIGFCLAILVIYSIYYDLQYGTIPNTTKAATVNAQLKKDKTPSQPEHKEIPHQKVQVQPGATVLSIVEHINKQSSVSIQKVVHDFEFLNPGVDANKIKIGQTYLFPVYDKKK